MNDIIVSRILIIFALICYLISFYYFIKFITERKDNFNKKKLLNND